MADFFNKNPLNYFGIQYLNIVFKGWKSLGKPAGSYNTTYLNQTSVSNGINSGLSLTIKDNCRAQYDPSVGADPTNKTRLDDLAGVMFSDIVDWCNPTFDLVFNGIINPCTLGTSQNEIESNAYIDTIEFSYQDSDATTRIYSYPFNYINNFYSHYDWAGEPTPINNVFVAGASIPAGTGLACQTTRLNDAGTAWSTSGLGSATFYNPSMAGNTFNSGDQGVGVPDQWGNLIIVEEDCPPTSGASAVGPMVDGPRRMVSDIINQIRKYS